MKKFEIEEQRELPYKYRPLTAWAYFGYTILYSLPIIGLIFLIIHALSDANINRRSFARSFFCVLIILLIVFGIFFATGLFGILVGDFANNNLY